MPYLAATAEAAHTDGLPVLRHLLLEFGDDRSALNADTQYMLGDSVLVAPVLDADGQVDVYVPDGVWTSLLDGSTVTGPRWVHQVHSTGSLPVLVRPGSVLPWGNQTSRPDYDWADGVTLRAFELADGDRREVVVADGGDGTLFVVERAGDRLVATGPASPWRLQSGDVVVDAVDGHAELTLV
jgi:alpha-D-xyloside xylohydrolase